MHITVQTRYDLQYITMRLCGYLNYLIEPSFLALSLDMEYIMYHLHEPMMYSKDEIFLKTRAHFNVYSRQVMQKPTKHKNSSTSYTHNVMHIMHDISVTGTL